MFVYDKTLGPKVVLGHCDLVTWLSDFAFYFGFLLVYEHISFTLCLRMTRPLTLTYFCVIVTLFHATVTLLYILTLGMFSYVFIIMS